MTTSVTDDRSRFEAYWQAKENFKESFLAVDSRYPDYYGNPVVQGSWEGYKAAIRSQVNANDACADRNWIAGAQWGFGRGLENDNASLADAIEARQRDIKAIIGEGD